MSTGRTFYCSMVYELGSETEDAARKLLLAELVGRRWHDRVRDRRMPRNAVWMDRKVTDEQTTNHVHALCARELREAAAAVSATGRKIKVLRVWIQVAGAGTYGLGPEGFFDDVG